MRLREEKEIRDYITKRIAKLDLKEDNLRFKIKYWQRQERKNISESYKEKALKKIKKFEGKHSEVLEALCIYKSLKGIHPLSLIEPGTLSDIHNL